LPKPATTPEYGRILLKLSGEILAGEDKSAFINPPVLSRVTREIMTLLDLGIQVGMTIGGGNLFRGTTLSANGLSRRTADQIGMLATVMNALAICEAVENAGRRCHVMSAIQIPGIVETYNPRICERYLDGGALVVFAAGTSNPFFSTDTAACLRGIEINADLVLKATKVDGVYSKDPALHADAEFFPRLTYNQVLDMKLGFMDLAAICLCRDHALPVRVFDFNPHIDGTLVDMVRGVERGTLISN